MSEHERFTLWVRDNGVKIDGVKPLQFPSRGLGLVAEKHLKVGYLDLLLSTALTNAFLGRACHCTSTVVATHQYGNKLRQVTQVAQKLLCSRATCCSIDLDER